jgi:hypothetical protein
MREQLQALVDRWHDRGIPSILWVLEELKRILAASPPVVSVKPGWLCKDRDGAWWCQQKPELFADGKWETPGICLYLSKKAFTDIWATSHPNGGPECLLEVKP